MRQFSSVGVATRRPEANGEKDVEKTAATVAPPQPVYISKTETLFTNQLVVRHGQILSKRFKVDVAVMSDFHVTGSFRASGGSGNDVIAVLADADQFENFKNGHAADTLYDSGKTTVEKVDVPITTSGDYVFAFSKAF